MRKPLVQLVLDIVSCYIVAMTNIENKLCRLLHKIAKEQQLVDYELQVTPISTGGANYSSTLHVVKIISKNKEDLDLFIKVAAISMKIRETFNVKIFHVENLIYTRLMKIYMDIEEKHKLPVKSRVRIAKYYGADMTPPTETLVLENLTAQGFVVHDRMKSIDWQYASTAVTELVKLHSLSMAFYREDPDEFKDFTENNQFEWLNETIETVWKPGFEKAMEVALEKNKGKLKKFFDQFDFDNLKRLYDPLRCKVITHGDFRPSNLMHRKRDDGSLEVITVDYQMIQVSCPIYDLLYLIVTGTDKEFRAKYFDKLIDHYYTQLSEAMERLGIDPETTYSRADFDFELKEKLPYGLAVAAITLPIVTVETENAPKVSGDTSISDFAVQKTGKVFPDRMNGIIDDFVRWGVLED